MKTNKKFNYVLSLILAALIGVHMVLLIWGWFERGDFEWTYFGSICSCLFFMIILNSDKILKFRMFSLEGCTMSNRVRSARYISDILCLPGGQYLVATMMHTFKVVASSHRLVRESSLLGTSSSLRSEYVPSY